MVATHMTVEWRLTVSPSTRLRDLRSKDMGK